MYLIFSLIVFVVSISFWHWRSVRGATQLKPIKAASSSSFIKNYRKELIDGNKWQKYAQKYDAVTVQKRRTRFTTTLNELLTRQSFSASSLPGWYPFSKRMDNLSVNPAKVLRLVGWLVLYSTALSAFGQDEQTKDYLDRGNAQYKAKDYSAALESYRATLGFQLKPSKLANVHYKIALIFNKLHLCDSARVHFAIALENDAENGGASSLSKFDEKARECNFNRADASNSSGNSHSQEAVPAEPTQPYVAPDNRAQEVSTEAQEDDSTSWVGYFFSAIFIFFGSWLVLVIWRSVSGQNSKVAQQQRLELDKVLNDEAFWDSQMQAGYSPAMVKQVRAVITKANATLSLKSTHKTVAQLHMHLRWLQTNPKLYFQPDAFQTGYAALLGHFLPYDFYCFFTAECIAEGKSRVVLIEHPNKPELSRKVFASEKFVRGMEKGTKLKVLTHLVNGKYVHWSNDDTFYTPFLSHLSPMPTGTRTGLGGTPLQMMESWQGTAKGIDLHQYYEIFTDAFPFFLFPHSDTIVQAVIPYQGQVPATTTGFETAPDTFVANSGTDSFLDGMATGMLLDSMTSSIHTHHDHFSDVS
ncbi:MAG: hypothetical protein V4714_09625 [Bacteroidota bacterium]